MNPDVAIIVPIYNTGQYLSKCIDGILSQDYSDYILILVDDGSTDGCYEICDEYAFKHDNIKVIHQQNGGLSDARNAGIDLAVKDKNIKWLCFIDSDDYVDETYISSLKELANKFNTKCSVCAFYNVPCDGNILKKQDYKDTIEFVTDTDSAYMYKHYDKAFPYSLTCAWGKMFHIDVFKDVRFPKGRIMEDRFTVHHLLFQCPEVAITTKALYMYVQTKNSIMRSDWNPQKLDFIDAFQDQISFCKANNYSRAFYESAREYVDYFCCELGTIRKSEYAKQYYITEFKEYIHVLREYRTTVGNKNTLKYFCYAACPVSRPIAQYIKRILLKAKKLVHFARM